MKKTKSLGLHRQDGFKIFLLAGAVIAVLLSVIVVNTAQIKSEPQAASCSQYNDISNTSKRNAKCKGDAACRVIGNRCYKKNISAQITSIPRPRQPRTGFDSKVACANKFSKGGLVKSDFTPVNFVKSCKTGMLSLGLVQDTVLITSFYKCCVYPNKYKAYNDGLCNSYTVFLDGTLVQKNDLKCKVDCSVHDSDTDTDTDNTHTLQTYVRNTNDLIISSCSLPKKNSTDDNYSGVTSTCCLKKN